MRLTFFSAISILYLFAGCNNSNKLPEFSLEDLHSKEQDSVTHLINYSRELFELGDYEKAIINLEIILDHFATFSEVLEAQALLETSKNKLIILKINNATSISTVLILIKNNIDPEIAIVSSKKVEHLILQSESIQELTNYLDQPLHKEHQALADLRIHQLEELIEQNAYQSALENKSSRQWKIFLENYPDHPLKNEIEKEIILLEIEEIFAGEYGEIPGSQLLGSKNFIQSEVQIKNDTRYTLTIWYSGPNIKKISIPPGLSQSIRLKSGDYRIAASVNASHVRNYAGTESLYGEYSSIYYISSAKY